MLRSRTLTPTPIYIKLLGKGLSEGKAFKFYFETHVNFIMLGCFGHKAKIQ